MKTCIKLVLALLIFGHSNSFAQQASAKQTARNNALSLLRNFRDSLTAGPKSSTRDSLRDKTNKLINFMYTLDDTEQIGSLNKYFAKAEHVFQITDPRQRASALHHINLDLQLKMSGDGKLSSLGIESGAEIFKNCDVVVDARLMGQKNFTGTYTVYWSQFTGIDQLALISANDNDGSSKNLDNPYKLNIRLPGYVTFWIVDPTHKKVYRSAPDYFIMATTDNKIEVNFVPLK